MAHRVSEISVHIFHLLTAFSFWPHLVMLSDVTHNVCLTVIQQTLHRKPIMNRVILRYKGKFYINISSDWNIGSPQCLLPWTDFFTSKDLCNSNSVSPYLSCESSLSTHIHMPSLPSIHSLHHCQVFSKA